MDVGSCNSKSLPGMRGWLSLSVVMPLSAPFGNIHDGHQQESGGWDGKTFLIRCPAGPKALLHVAQRHVP